MACSLCCAIPREMQRLRNDYSLIPSAVEEMLRYESPSQHTARMCPTDREMGGKTDPETAGGDCGDGGGEPRSGKVFPIPTVSTSRVKTIGIWPSAMPRIFVLARRWREWKGRSCWRRSCGASRISTLSPEPLEWRSNLGIARVEGVESESRRGRAAAKNQAANSSRNAEATSSAVSSTASSGCPYEAQGTSGKSVEIKSNDKQAEGKQEVIRKYLQSRMSQQGGERTGDSSASGIRDQRHSPSRRSRSGCIASLPRICTTSRSRSIAGARSMCRRYAEVWPR